MAARLSDRSRAGGFERLSEINRSGRLSSSIERRGHLLPAEFQLSPASISSRNSMRGNRSIQSSGDLGENLGESFRVDGLALTIRALGLRCGF